MKKLIVRIVSFLMLFTFFVAVFYLGVAFYSLDIDFKQWGDYQRFFVAFFGGCTSFVVALFFSDFIVCELFE